MTTGLPSLDEHELIVNGRTVGVSVDGDVALLYVLRNDLGLKGTRFGCGEGSCGSCTILVDGTDVHSCQVTVREAANRVITTIEGLLDENLYPGRVQQALIDHRAGQCGFCLSGIVMRIEAGLAAGDDRPALIERLTRNLCRCGAHVRILRAIDDLLEDTGS